MSLYDLSRSNLNGILAICFFSFHLCHLAPINLDNSTRYMSAPTIPIMCHSYFIPQKSYSLAISLSWLGFQNAELRIDLVLICTKSWLLAQHRGIINRFGLHVVLHTHFMKRRYRGRLRELLSSEHSELSHHD